MSRLKGFIQHSINSNNVTATQNLYLFPLQLKVQTLAEYFHYIDKLLKNQPLCTNNISLFYAASNSKIKTAAMLLI